MRDLDELTQFAYGLLDETTEAGIREHAAGCPDCSSRIERLVAEHRFLEACLRPDAPPPPLGVDARETPRPSGGLPG